jgi:hypothetical protein
VRGKGVLPGDQRITGLQSAEKCRVRQMACSRSRA